MQYSPKLKKAMKEIQMILFKNDIAGMVILHTPGHGEFYLKLTPSYSCIKTEGESIRIHAKVSDFKSRTEMESKLADTSNMLHTFSEVGGNMILGVMNASELLDAKIEAKHNGNGFTSQTQQDN
jgi:hypothetical protein